MIALSEADKKTMDDYFWYKAVLFEELEHCWAGDSTESYNNVKTLWGSAPCSAVDIEVTNFLYGITVQVSTGCMLVKFNGEKLEITNEGGALIMSDGTYRIALYPQANNIRLGIIKPKERPDV